MQTATQVLQIEGIKSDVLLKAVSELLDNKLSELKLPGTHSEISFLTRQEVADLYKISLPTVHAWIHAGILKPYKLANKTRFIKSEVIAAAKDMNKVRNR